MSTRQNTSEVLEARTGGPVDGGARRRPVHGGIRPSQLRELGLDPGMALDFSASISPLGPPQGLWARLQSIDLTAYPDPECLELKEAIAGYHGVTEDQVLVGNGSTELIHLLARSSISQAEGSGPQSVLLFAPTYGEYAGACSLAGAEVFELAAHRERDFAWDWDEAKASIMDNHPALVFLCNPNNPTGVYLDEDDVRRLAQTVTEVGGVLVLDEAYVNFVDKPWSSLSLLERPAAEHVIVLRSMTKDYALTGLRLGYSLAGPELTARLARLQPDWSVNSLAQAAGLLALFDEGYLPAARQAVEEAKSFLTAGLSDLGFTVLPSAANFLLVEVGDARGLSDMLMRRGMFVRDCTSFGLADCIRIGIRPMPDCQRLLQEVANVVEERGR